MTVSAGISREAVFLGISVLAGAGLFFLYDILRIFRRIKKHGVILIGIEDILYWLVCTAVVFLMIYQKNDGMVRGFALGGVFVGMLVYYSLFSRFVIKLNVLVWKRILQVLGKTGSFLFGPIVKNGKKFLGFLRRQLKKIYKAVKMGLCKL